MSKPDFSAAADGQAAFNMFFAEVFATAVFISVIMSVKYDGLDGHLIWNALTVATTLYGMSNLINKVSGACLNPAVGLIQTVF